MAFQIRFQAWFLLFAFWLAEHGPGLSAWAQTPSDADPHGFEHRQLDRQIDVLHDGRPIATYRFAGQSKPIIWPLMGPDSVEMTRKWPMSEDDPKEKRDHVHHRSLWLTHGDVNGVDFWSENEEHGSIVHVDFQSIESNQEGSTIASTNHWKSRDGSLVLVEKRRMRFHGSAKLRMLDFECQLSSPDHDLVFGDTKEGSFGIRVAESMKVEASPPGSIVNADGLKDAEAWGKPSAWVDYRGPIGDKTYGVAILAHPSSFRAPGRWHVRGYGLFAHNPFGLRDFVGDEKAQGGATLPKGDRLTLAYRVLLHSGDWMNESVEQAYVEYAKTSLTGFAP